MEILKKQAGNTSLDTLTYMIKELSSAEAMLKKSSQPKAYLEIVLINLATLGLSFPDQSSLLERITSLERKLNSLKSPEAKKEAPVQAVPAEKPRPRISQDNVNFEWEKVLEYLKDENNMDVYPYLIETKASLQGSTVFISFTSDLFKDMIMNDRNNIKTIKDAIFKVLSIDCDIALNKAGQGGSTDEELFEQNVSRAAAELGIKIQFE
jgi:DNA polymerase III gamma/tau subunit